MSDQAIVVESLSKLYKIGAARSGSLRETITHGFNRLFKRRDAITEAEEFWALKDVSFEIKAGEAIGIIGRNGAGKSTLLKILSRITDPTTGKITINGRVASLLEVGTGFHPELTGKENIFMNGAILGMRQAEIKRKLDEIIAFSGIEKFINTPVKHYSSGMYVRLAFAVAAHLEPEILIIDEVLAVGDAEFQKKCLGKMEEVSKGQGRTVIFVSHNMGAVKSLCSKAILLDKGQLSFTGTPDAAISRYLATSSTQSRTSYLNNNHDSNLKMEIHEVHLFVNGVKPESVVFDVFDKLSTEIVFQCYQDLSNYSIYLCLNQNNYPLFVAFEISPNQHLLDRRKKGKYRVKFDFPTPLLKAGLYSLDVHISRIGVGSEQIIEGALGFEISVISRNPRFQGFSEDRPGYIAFEPEWKYQEII